MREFSIGIRIILREFICLESEPKFKNLFSYTTELKAPQEGEVSEHFPMIFKVNCCMCLEVFFCVSRMSTLAE